MEKEKVLNIIDDVENKSNKDLQDALSFLDKEFNETKSLAIELTRHMDSVQVMYDKINEEIKKRIIK
jgi:hypothetical protein